MSEIQNDLVRYGVQWTGPQTPTCVPMTDGYWTPWHTAQARIGELERELLEAKEQRNAEMRLRQSAERRGQGSRIGDTDYG